jgi:hypothetical protein
MATEFLQIGSTAIDSASVTHVEFDGTGGAKVFVVSGAVVEVTGDEADEVAKAFGRHDAKHLTAKEAKADAKAEAEAAKALEPPPPAEPEPKSKAHGGHGAHR